jgi:hypothetical protein
VIHVCLCYAAVTVIDLLLLWCGGKLLGAIFGVDSRWRLGLFMGAALLEGGLVMFIRPRISLSGDILRFTVWLLLGLVAAPLVGLTLSPGAAGASYAALLLVSIALFLSFRLWQPGFVCRLSWLTAWTLLALFFSFSAYRLVLVQ